MNVKKHIPNFITCSNLFCGCLGIVFIFQGNMLLGCYMAGLAAILDFFDGFAARLLGVNSEMGKQLDSLADMVTFGVLPGVIMYFLMKNSISITSEELFLKQAEAEAFPHWLIFSGFSITIFSALRLAKFNIDNRQSTSFIGVPTPLNTLLIGSLPLIESYQPQFGNYDIVQHIHNPWFLLGLTIISSYLMIAEIPLFSFKVKSLAWNENKIKYLFLFASFVLLIIFHFIAIPFILLLYIILSAYNNPI